MPGTLIPKSTITWSRPTMASVRRWSSASPALWCARSSDGLLVYFGYPQAHDDDAYRAVRAGLDLVQALQRAAYPYRAGARAAPGATARDPYRSCRCQREGGRCEIRTARVGGNTPYRRHDLQELAAPDTVLISQTTYAVLQGAVLCQALGPQRLAASPGPLTSIASGKPVSRGTAWP